MNSRRRFCRIGALALALSALANPAMAELPKSSLNKEKGAIYIEDTIRQPVKLKVRDAGTVYADLQGQRPLGTLVPGQLATLVAFSDKACRVRAKATHGDVVGWVGQGFLEAREAGFFDKLKRIAERYEQVQEFIARKEVAIGMTPEEVVQALGKPDAQTARIGKEGASSVYEYITYERIPQTSYVRDRYNQLVPVTTYIKVETGHLNVSFENGLVSGIEATKGKLNWGNTKIVVPPITIY